MARHKPTNIHLVKDIDSANRALEEIAELKRRIEAIELEMNEKIDKAKAQAGLECAPIQARMSAIEAGLLAFAELNRTEVFGDKKTVKLNFGSIGFRKSSQIKTMSKVTWDMVLGKLKEMKFLDAIRTKEEVNKDELSTWPEERLKLVGARRVEKDAFWFETDAHSVAIESSPIGYQLLMPNASGQGKTAGDKD